MSESELIRTAEQIILAASCGDAGPAVTATIDAAGGVLSVAGTAVLGGLVKRSIDDLFERFVKAKQADEVTPDFEQTDHGAALLQEALRAMFLGLDETRAEAVKKVFLGLAMNPVEESLEKMDQLEIMRISCELSMWEVFALNMLDRYRIVHLDEQLAYDWEKNNTDLEARAFVASAQQPQSDFYTWMMSFCNNDKARFFRIKNAVEELHRKHIFIYGTKSGRMEIARQAKYIRNGNFTDLGWQLASHLRSEEVTPTASRN